MDWSDGALPPLIADVRAAAAPLCIALEWSTMFEAKAHHAPRLTPAHINVLEMEAVLALLKRLRREGCGALGSSFMWTPESYLVP